MKRGFKRVVGVALSITLAITVIMPLGVSAANVTAQDEDASEESSVFLNRVYNPNSGEHFYTGSVAEKDYLVSLGWSYEGIEWVAPSSSAEPVYRVYNQSTGDHHYTTNVGEKDYLVSIGWNYENIGWYSADKTGTPVYRLFNPNATGAGSHHYTTNVIERDYLSSIGWTDEGIGWYGIPVDYKCEEANAYIYSKEKTDKFYILKRDDLPNVAWINVMDFLKYDYNDKVQFEITKSGDVYTITKKNNGVTMEDVGATMVIDTAKDTVTFDRLEMFIITEDAYKVPGSTVYNPYIIEQQPEYAVGTTVKNAVYDLSKYNLDAVGVGDSVYLPIATVTDIFGYNYNQAEYVDSSVYFVHMGDEIGADMQNPYVNKSSIYNNTTRSQQEMDFAYNELCFVMDEIYGFPPNNDIADDMKAKGFDKISSENADISHLKNDYWMTGGLLDYYLGLNYLTGVVYDGGHTSMALLSSLNSVPAYSDTALVKEWMDPNREIKFPEDSQKYSAKLMADQMWQQQLFMAQSEAYNGSPNIVFETNNSTYVENGKKGIFAFDKFSYVVLPDLKQALDHAKDNGIEEFYFDFSCNGGGDERVTSYLMSLITGDGTFYLLNAKTNNVIAQKTKIDKNLDGVIDEKDDGISYNFNYKIVTSKKTFSAANQFACLAANKGIPVYGERSGGGTCLVYLLNHTDSMAYMLSGANTFIAANTWNNLESGAPLSEEWITINPDGSKDYSHMYDFLK